MRRALVVLTLVAIAALVAAIAVTLETPVAPSPSPLRSPIARALQTRIVVSLPRSGARRAQTDGIVNAVRLAVAEANSRVVAGDTVVSVEVEVLDSSGPEGAWSEAAERANVERAAVDGSVVAYVGPATLEGARIVAPVAAKADLLVLVPALTHPALTKRGYDDALFDALHPGGARVFLRTIPSDEVALRSLARYARDRGLVPVAAQSEGSAYGDLLQGGFVRLARAGGVEADDARAKLLYVAGTSAEHLARIVALRRAGLAVAGGEALLSDAFLKGAGSAAEGAVATFAGRPLENYTGGPGVFLRSYRDAYLIVPDPYAIFGYDAGLLTLDAIRRSTQGAIVDRASVRSAAFATRDLDGALGKWSVDADGDTTFASLQLYAVKALPGGTLAWVWDSEIRP